MEHGGRLLAVILLLAVAPSITYMGHWPLRIDVPFTSYYWGFPETWGPQGHTHGNHAHEDHGEHCHGESSCTTKPITSGAGFALVNETLLLLGVAGLLVRAASRRQRPISAGAMAPEPPPPRSSLSLA